MILYGEYKKRGGAEGHGHECYICKPEIDRKTGRRKARERGKKEAREQMLETEDR